MFMLTTPELIRRVVGHTPRKSNRDDRLLETSDPLHFVEDGNRKHSTAGDWLAVTPIERKSGDKATLIPVSCGESDDRGNEENRSWETSRLRQISGVVRDVLVIAATVAAGIHVLSNPQEVDAFLNWMIGRP